MDLIIIVALTAVIVPLLTLASVPEVVRAPLGLLFLLFFPGYALVAAIFPRRAWPGAVERLALSAVASLSLVALIGIALNYSPWGLRTGSILAFVGLFIVLASGLGLAYRQAVPADERLDFSPGSLAAWASRNLGQPAYPIAAALGALVAIAIMLLAVPGVAQRGASERFTEFYLLGADGTAEGYPTTLTVGEPAKVMFGIVNQEGSEAKYAVSLLINESPVIKYPSIQLSPGQRLELPVTFSLREAGEGQVVRFDLQKDGQTIPYRSLHLRLDGRAAPVDREPVTVALSEAEPESAAPPAPPPPAPPPPVTTEPTPSAHIVSRGESLTLIARDYGLPLSALLAVNDLADPNLIYPDQRINLPPPSGSTGSQ